VWFASEFHLKRAVQRQVEQALGPSGFLGMDNGEQDGRYMNYADTMADRGAPHSQQYLHFMRHFQRMTDDLGE